MDALDLNRATVHATVTALALVAALAVAPAHATGHGNAYALSAAATLHPGAAKQSGGRFSLTATLGGASSATPTPSGGGYALAAHLTAQPLTCESDLIFENGFDP